VKFPFLKGLGNDDPNQLWFVVKAVWEAQGVRDDHINKATLFSTLQDRTMTWYIKYSNDSLNVRVVDIKAAMNSEFSRPKSKMQPIFGFK